MDLQFLPTPGAYIPRTGSTYEKDFAIGSALFFLKERSLGLGNNHITVVWRSKNTVGCVAGVGNETSEG